MPIVYGCDDRRLEQVKTRYGYVSNSSSSSFIILNWNSLDDDKKDMILNYRNCVRELWEKNKLPLSDEHGALHIDFRALPDCNPSSEFVETHSVEEIAQWLREHKDADRINELANELDFGWTDDYWRFREKNGNLEMTTSMDNFDFEKWMDYIGGIEYKWTGENLGFFDDEEIKLDTSLLERLADINSRRSMDDESDEGAEGLHQDA